MKNQIYTIMKRRKGGIGFRHRPKYYLAESKLPRIPFSWFSSSQIPLEGRRFLCFLSKSKANSFIQKNRLRCHEYEVVLLPKEGQNNYVLLK